jgi:ubiquinone/menaquinone biosynthesis C-methylase UbiE
VLDVGCGHGGWARWIADALPGLEPHGTDVFDACRYPIAFARYDGGRLPYADSAFDACVAFGMLHHADDPARVVGEISRVCRAGARVIVVEDIAASRLQTWLTRWSDLYENRLRSWWRALTGAARWGHTAVPMTYEYRSYPEHGVFVLEKRRARR